MRIMLFFMLMVVQLALGAQSIEPNYGKPSGAQKSTIDIYSGLTEIEVGQSLELMCIYSFAKLDPVTLVWTSSNGSIEKSALDEVVRFKAPLNPGEVRITATATQGKQVLEKSLLVNVREKGAFNRTVRVKITVDTKTLAKVWVDADHPAEKFAGPLKIKGEFRIDPDTGEGFAGGSWPVYDMYDDGTHGDDVKGDGIYSILWAFEKTDAKVHFAFDDAGTYRKQWESGVGFALKAAWQKIADAQLFDGSDLFFIPSKDVNLSYGKDEAARSKIDQAR